MQIANRLAGFTMAEADEMRKAMGKKKAEIMLAARDKFVAGCLKNAIAQDLAVRIGDQLAEFSKYCFNKSHATAYGLLCWQTAYLKAHHPREYMAALMTVFLDKSDKLLQYIEECRRMKIPLLAPDVNTSGRDFSVEGEAIRCGFGSIKNLGDKTVESIVGVRTEGGPFRSLVDFCSRADLHAVDRRNLEGLLKCGAFDVFGATRASLLEGLGEAIAFAEGRREDKRTGQRTLFSGSGGAALPEPTLPVLEEWPVEEKLSYEKEVLGFYLTANPLRKYEGLLEGLTTVTLDRATELAHNQDLVAGGMVSNIRVRTLKQGERKGEKYLSFTLTDLAGRSEALLFGKDYEREQRRVAEDAIVFVVGSMLSPQDKPAIRVSEVIPVEEAPAKLAGAVVVRVPPEDPPIAQLKDLLAAHPGPLPVVLEVAGERPTRIALPDTLRVAPSDLLRVELDELLGEASVRYGAKPLAARPRRERRWKSGE